MDEWRCTHIQATAGFVCAPLHHPSSTSSGRQAHQLWLAMHMILSMCWHYQEATLLIDANLFALVRVYLRSGLLNVLLPSLSRLNSIQPSLLFSSDHQFFIPHLTLLINH